LVWGMIESMARSAFSRISNIGKYPKTLYMASDIFAQRFGQPFSEKTSRKRRGKVAARRVMGMVPAGVGW